ncbi:hypothetical protein HNQ72_006138 [Rhizobium wenxiniae]|uniref:Uncharacterized protein n=1 Tax=Rhizobium wenxiniae TaxID=1737357 RepID=A0A7X0D388_9HYPH|nr:hypothetical protein [Rhizobium wenxiniae]
MSMQTIGNDSGTSAKGYHATSDQKPDACQTHRMHQATSYPLSKCLP